MHYILTHQMTKVISGNLTGNLKIKLTGNLKTVLFLLPGPFLI